MTSLDHQIQRAADLVRQATHVVALSGAGISTPSGIPDFRSPDSGLWDNADPMVVASLPAFVRDPQPFYTWFHPLLSALLAAAPNPARAATEGVPSKRAAPPAARPQINRDRRPSSPPTPPLLSK